MSDKVSDFVKKYGAACGGDWSDILMAALLAGLIQVYKGLKDRAYDFSELWDILEEDNE